jgi:pyruvate,water dikinase
MHTYRRESIGCDAVEITKVLIAKGGKLMSSFVLCFEDQDIDKTKLKVVGGKATNLGELTRIEEIYVPDGFCISTEAFERIIGETSWIN